MTENREHGIMQTIYNKINEMIGAGNQLFSMQFPAQPLNENLYRYETSDRNSVLTRPFSVAEQEFRLSDQLFDVSPITAGPNGEKLSVVYDTLLNNLIPKVDYLIPFIKERAGLGHWLLEDTNEVENGRNLSRIELCKKLYQEYLEAKNKWNQEKNDKFDSLKNEPGGLDEYAKWQSSYGMVRSEQLNSLYDDVVVRGHLHEVLTLLGYLNASSIAEQLEISKQKMRNSARLSLDESLTIYPVQMSPNNWFKALSPNLNPEDLTMAKESIADIYRDKQKELLRAKDDLQKAELMNATQDDIDAAQRDVDTAKKELARAESGLVKQYGDGVVGVAKIYFSAFAKGGVAGKINPAKAKGLGAEDNQKYLDALQQAVDGISKTYETQQKLTKAIGDLSALSAKKAQVESREWTFNKLALKQRIQELEIDVTYYADLLAGVTRSAFAMNRIAVKRNSFLETNPNDHTGELNCEFGFSEDITGGSFKIKIGSKNTADITINANSWNDADCTTFASAVQTALVAIWPGSTAAHIAGSPGYFTIVFKNVADSNVIVDETSVQPIAVPKKPVTLVAQKSEEDAEVEGMFTDIVLKIEDSASSSSQSSQSSASASSWSVSAWFASAGGSSNSSSASAQQRSEFFNQEIEIGFRVAKVSFDRGGWFNPQLFKMSHAFSRLADIRTAGRLTVEDIKAAAGDQHKLRDLVTYKDEKNQTATFVMPSFPVAMAIVKDVTIKVKMTKTSSQSAKSVMESASASSGGFLCFSCSQSASSKSSSEYAMSGSHGEYYYIRIPGPQVIGYFMQLVPEDISVKHQPVFKADGSSDILDALRLYDSAKEILKLSAKDGQLALPKTVEIS